MPIAAGDIIYVQAFFTPDKRYKYLICVCPVKYLYLVINTRSYSMAPTAQLQITVAELPCLEHLSHVDTSKCIKLTKMETVNPVEANPKLHKGTLSAELRLKIKKLVLEHGIMPEYQAEILQANF